ncbi:MAG: CotH kinase family protein [Bacteroidota bacterium]
MILSDVSSNSSIRKKLGMKGFAALLALAALLGLWYGWPQAPASALSTDEWVRCTAEHREGEDFVDDGYRFGFGHRQSSEKAFSGRYSCFLDKGEGLQFGFGFDIPQVQPGDVYEAYVWRYRAGATLEQRMDGFLVASGEGSGEFYHSKYLPADSRDGWEQIRVSFSIPIDKSIEKVKVYVYTSGQTPVYFDDLSVRKTGNIQEELLALPPKLNLKIQSEELAKLRRKRAEAMRVGLLEREEKDWVKARIESGGNKEELLSAYLRLKGDWLDHLVGDKWSFRIKLRKENTWNRMMNFSIHTPEARSHLHEWVLHQLFEREDVLTTRYDFVQVDLNQKPLGIYAYEEHFDKLLVEYKHRREGPIVKFIEDGFWAGIKRQLEQVDGVDYDIDQSVRLMETAEIKPFKEGKIAASEVLSKQYELAQSLLHQYRYGLKSVEEIFDIDRLARYYAICDLMGAYHGLAWHNQRFYYNPVLSRLEPIGFDGFASYVGNRKSLLGQGAFNQRRIDEERLDNKLFLDQKFTRLYIQYLYQYSSKEYVERFMAEIEEGLASREILLQQEFTDYRFDREKMRQNCHRVHLMILPHDQLSLRAYTSDKSTFSKKLKIANTHSLPIQLIGYGPKANRMTDTLESPMIFEAFTPRLVKQAIEANTESNMVLDTFSGSTAWQAYREQEFISYSELPVKPSTQYLFYQLLGLDSIFQSPISIWDIPLPQIPNQELLSTVQLQRNPIYNVSDQMIYFKAGEHQVSRPLIIPKGYQVIFEAGTSIDLINQAFLLSYSPIFMYGTEEAPITILSSDQTGMGFTVLQAGKESKLKHAIFDHLNTLNYKNWTLTGAVSFYESDVSIDRCVFRNNHCEDALNIIRSEFSLNNSLISHTFADGLDADFCKGYIGRTRVEHTGNDGMDVSGSNIIIDNCQLQFCGDKGVSVGEESDVTIFSIDISDSGLAIASKDLSVLVIEDINLSNCELGFTAFQKKPEYGGANIIVNQYKANNIKRLYNIQAKCALQLVDKVIRP